MVKTEVSQLLMLASMEDRISLVRTMTNTQSKRSANPMRPEGEGEKAFRETRQERLAWWLILLFMSLCAIGGGSNRSEVASLLFLRPIAVIVIAAFLLIPRSPEQIISRVPLVLLAVYAAHVASQLIPLPPELWTTLPGRAIFSEAAIAAGVPQPYRPISLAPDRTWDSLLATTTGFVILLGMTRLGPHQWRSLIGAVLTIILISGLLAVLQATGVLGDEGHLYQLTTSGEAVGLFANRNHQAALLACALPLLRVWLILQTQPGRRESGRVIATAITAMLVVVMIVVTGSRAGVLLGTIGAVGATSIRPIGVLSPNTGRAGNKILVIVALISITIVLAVAITSGRALSYNRLLTGDYIELRVLNLPAMIQMLYTFAPIGTGYGSFDRIFPMFEPDNLLRPDLFNRAHNDFLEVAITGGLIGIMILSAGIIWSMWVSWRVFRAAPLPVMIMARGASVILVIFAFASTVDYPLRTPLIGALTAVAFGFLGSAAATLRKAVVEPSPVA